MKKISYAYNFKWMGYLFMGIGVFLLSGGLIPQVIPITEANFNVKINGVPQPYTPENVQFFRRMFLGMFGGSGLLLLLIGLIILWRLKKKNRAAEWLKVHGVRVQAEVLRYNFSLLKINRRRMKYLVCAHTLENGEQLLFKSGLMKPKITLALPENKLPVYYDPNDPKKYWVDLSIPN